MNVVQNLSETLSQYLSRIKKNKTFFDYAKATSIEELFFNFQHIKDSKTQRELIKSLITITNSGVWVSRAAFHFLKSFIDLRYLNNHNKNSIVAQEIIAGVVNHRTVPASDQLIFKTIYDEITYSHLHIRYISPIVVPKINVTIVLVSGVLNEIFATPAFKRGAESLLDEYGIKHISPLVDGKKGALENSAKLKKQIEEYLKENPNEKLWFFSFSKGGIDTLHLLKNASPELLKNIVGVSLIASPIMGTDHVDHTLLKALNKISTAPEYLAKKVLDIKIDPILKDVQNSLAKSYREVWFKRNHKKLPKNIFYTAIAFESKWHDSHIYMMLTKFMLRSETTNDGVVDTDKAQFPPYFHGINLGILEGHHLVGVRSSFYDQEALMKAHLIYLHYKRFI
jgi:hypothetical protein